MVKTFWSKLIVSILASCTLLITSSFVITADSYSDLFVMITDTQTVLSQGENEEALDKLQYFKEKFDSLEHTNSEKGKIVKERLSSILKSEKVTQSGLVNLSKELLDFEKEQNPIDLNAEKIKFKTRVYPILEDLKTAVDSKNQEDIRTEYNRFNSVWTRNESVIRDQSQAYYGKIETAISFLHAAIESNPYDNTNVEASFIEIQQYIQDFIDGKSISKTSSEVTNLAQGVELLKTAYRGFTSDDSAKAKKAMKTFITSWPTFEGEVSARSASLYTKVESQTPIIMVKGYQKKYQNLLKTLIDELSLISSRSSYNAIDAMSILLREGVEALLIILALVEILKAAKQTKGLRWIYAGALVGILASLLSAFLLQLLFPAISSGNNREIIEGFIGIVAVIMMFGIGLWLHSKSNMKAWTDYMERQINLVMSTGSFISMFTLSFLAVFREGAETILFYVGILPHITLSQLSLGIVSAIVLLIIIAVLLSKSTKFLPMHLLFKVLTVLIYLLAFKMLGVSIHALQLTSVFPNNILLSIPTIDWLGIYPSMEGVISQFIFLFLLVIIYFSQYFRSQK